MNVNKKIALGGLAALATAGLLTTTIAPANADPVRDYAATGSDTIQDVWNGLTNGSTAVAPSIASYNAFDADGNTWPIQTKTGGAWFQRPSGSGEGVKSLSAVWDSSYTSHQYGSNTALGGTIGTVHGQAVLNHEDVDFARSSGGPTAGTGLKYLPFARDAVSVAINTTGAASTLATVNLTTGQLNELYTGLDNTSDSVVTFTSSLAGPDYSTGTAANTHVFINGVEVHPQIPQSGSGTRKFFLGAIGGNNAIGGSADYIADPGLPSAGGLPENSGSAIPNAGDLIPFSAAQWIAQQRQAPGVVDTTAGLSLVSINGSAAVSGTGASAAPGALFGGKNLSGDYNVVPGSGVGVFNRDTFNIVPTTFIDSPTAKQSTLVSILTSGTASAIFGATGKADIKLYGFGTLSYSTTPGNFLNGAFQH